MRKNIIPCTLETTNGPAPKTLRELGAERIVGRKITRWSPYLSTYGMGGCGFFGARLSKTADYPEEWLILMLWGATDWLQIDGENASAGVYEQMRNRHDFVATYRLLHINYQYLRFARWFRINILGWEGLPEWDRFSRKIVGKTIIHAELTDSSTRFVLRKGGKEHVIEISVPACWQWNTEESHLDAWGISPTMIIYC